MRDNDRQLVNWFKAELKSYLNSKAMFDELSAKIKELDNWLSYHSPALTSDTHGGGMTQDEKLAKYATLREEYMVQYKSLEARQKAVESILAAMPNKSRGIIIRIFKRSTTIENEALKNYYTRNELQGMIDREILKAVRKFTNRGTAENDTI